MSNSPRLGAGAVAANSKGRHRPSVNSSTSTSAQLSRPPADWQTSPVRNLLYARHWLAALRTEEAR